MNPASSLRSRIGVTRLNNFLQLKRDSDVEPPGVLRDRMTQRVVEGGGGHGPERGVRLQFGPGWGCHGAEKRNKMLVQFCSTRYYEAVRSGDTVLAA